MQRIGQWLFARELNAALVVLALTLLPFVGLSGDFFAGILVALITLRKGAKAGVFLLLWVALPSVALLFLHRVGIYDTLLIRCVIVWGLALVLRQTRNWYFVLQILLVVGLLAVILFHCFVANPAHFWVGHFSNYLSMLSQQTELKMKDFSTSVKALSKIMTGITVAGVLLGLFFKLLAARFFQAALFNKGGLKPEGYNLRVGMIDNLLVLLGVAGVYLQLSWVTDVFPVLLLPSLIAGFSLLHMWLDQYAAWRFSIILLYISCFFIPYLLLLVVLLGFTDGWLNYRQRFNLVIKN